MNSYQLTLLLKNDLDEKARKELLDSVAGKFAEIGKQDLWGSRNLVYPIKKQDKAFYAHFEFKAQPQEVPSLDKMLKLNEDVIRYLLIRV